MALRARWRGFELPTTITYDQDAENPNKGTFTAEPFESGFGVTIGNSLRRVLIGSLEGAAATQIKIEGVLHEFSSLPGVVEDVTDIVLNVKALRFKVKTDEPRKLYIDVKKKGVITALDIKADALVEVVNKDQHICELSEDTSFKMEITVRKGRRYVTAQENEAEDGEIGVIPVDSIFRPVRRVRFSRENTRVGQLTDYDKLILEIETDGSITPQLALVEAGKILRKHLVPFVNYRSLGTELEGETFDIDLGGAAETEGVPAEAGDASVDPSLSVAELDLSVRALNSLEGAGIETLGELLVKSGDELLALRNFGKTTLKELEARLAQLGLELKGSETVTV
ncbi:MAG: DNA-directed RNA polymerase subunit alpha [Planctomycetota bacterium]|jgi:DNA-directed RNA polymerase subunit alpha